MGTMGRLLLGNLASFYTDCRAAALKGIKSKMGKFNVPVSNWSSDRVMLQTIKEKEVTKFKQ